MPVVITIAIIVICYLFHKLKNKLDGTEQREKELSDNFNEIKESFPHGLKRYIKLHPGIKRKENAKAIVVENRDEIEKYEEFYCKAQEYKEWEQKQKNFNSLYHKIVQDTICKEFYTKRHIYKIPYKKINEDGCTAESEYKVINLSLYPFCYNYDLDHGTFSEVGIWFNNKIKGNLRKLEFAKKFRLKFDEKIYEKIDSVIYELNKEYDISVYFSYNNEWDASRLNFYYSHFPVIERYECFCEDLWKLKSDNFKQKWPCVLEVFPRSKHETKIAKEDREFYPNLKYMHIVVIEMETSRSHLEEVCKNIIENNNDNHPLITYISVFKELSRGEMAIEIQNINKKKEAKKIKEYFDIEHYVNEIYHFTSKENVDSIKRMGGLFSWYYMKQNKYKIPEQGGDAISMRLDEAKGIEDYVHLSFCEAHPMAYKLFKQEKDLVLLKIDPIVATWGDTLFSDINAAEKQAKIGGTFDDLKRIDFDAVNEWLPSKEDKNYKTHQAEVLVKTFVPIELILNIDEPEEMDDYFWDGCYDY